MFITDFPLFSLMCLHYKEIGLLDEFLTDGKQVIEDVDFYTASLVKADYYNWKNHTYLHNNCTSYGTPDRIGGFFSFTGTDGGSHNGH